MSNIKFSQLPNLANITANTIVPVVEGGINYTVTADTLQDYVNSNIGNLAVTSVSATGNITGNYFFGNGSQLTGLPETYTNANVTSLLSNFGSNSISTTGNISAGYLFGNASQLSGLPATYTNANVTSLLSNFGSNSISTTGNISAGNFAGNGSQLTAITAANVVGTVSQATLANTVAISNINSQSGSGFYVCFASGPGNNTVEVDDFGNGFSYQPSTGTVNTTVVNATTFTGATFSAYGNITGSYFIGNGSQLTGLPATYSNAQVASFLANFGSNSISTTGNVTAANFSATGTNSSFVKLSLTQGAQSTSTTTGTLVVSGGVGMSGNLNVGSNANIVGTTTLNNYIEGTNTSGLTTGSSLTPTMSNGPVQRITANSNFTLQAPSGMVTGQSITIILRQDATGNRVMTANSAYKWAGGNKTLSTAGNSIDMILIFYDGINYLTTLNKGYV